MDWEWDGECLKVILMMLEVIDIVIYCKNKDVIKVL